MQNLLWYYLRMEIENYLCHNFGENSYGYPMVYAVCVVSKNVCTNCKRIVDEVDNSGI